MSEDEKKSGEGDKKGVGNFMSAHMFDDIIPKFNGTDKSYTSTKWLQDIDDSADIFEWTPAQKLIVARRSLTGTAALWLKSEKIFKSYGELKLAIQKEFPETINIKEVHEMMSIRKKKKDETCHEYMLAMKELGKRGKFPDYVVIQYIIDGIEDYENNKAILYGVTTYPVLKEKLLIYESMKKNMTSKRREVREHNMAKKVSGGGVGHQSVTPNRNCYKCGASDHIAKVCKNGVKCYRCNQFGHIALKCDSRWRDGDPRQLIGQGSDVSGDKATTETVARSGYYGTGSAGEPRAIGWHSRAMCMKMASDGSVGSNELGAGTKVNESENELRQCQTLNVNRSQCLNKSVKILNLSGCKVESLIDSGSDLNLIAVDLIFELNITNLDREKIVFSGVGARNVTSMGKVVCDMDIDGHSFNLVFHVVQNDVMPYRVILGQPFIQKTTLVFDKGSVSVVPQHDSILCGLVSDSSADVSIGYVPDQSLKDEVQQLVVNYNPVQIKEAPIEMHIVLKDDIPVAQRPRRLALKEQEAVDTQIGEWLQKGIIRPSFSEYASPLVLVRKKDGSLRVCVDFRRVNAKMVRDEFPLPVIDDHLDKLLGAKVFSKLDLKDAFFHLKINENSIKYTSFVTQNGQYEFMRAPFGLSICPSYFTRFITIIFRELISKEGVLIFIDDVIIPSINYEEGVRKLKMVLKTAAEYGLQINWKKSDILTTRVEYLGHVIENNTIKPSPDKTDAVMKFPQPHSQKELQSFIGLASYFRKFIEGFSMIARPLTDLLRKDKYFYFGEDERLAFHVLKQKLSEQPVLRIFDPALPTELHTDASQVAYSAVLMQQDPNDKCLHPIYYMSKKTTDAEKKYSRYELEALAIVEGVKKFRKYLIGISFKIVTDCLAFEMTLKKKDLVTRIARWVLCLQEFDYKVEHRAGTKMRHVDALSRYPYICVTVGSLHNQIGEAQNQDEGLRAIKEILKEGTYMDYWMSNNILYKGEQKLLVIPKRMEKEILERVHSNGHFSNRKMKELINRDYFISDVDKKINDYLLTCIPCILASRKSGKQEGYLNPIHKEATPLHTLHVDFIGPLTATQKQYNHILTVVDAFTKFVWLFPTKSITSREVISKLQIHQQVFGNPNRVISDKGTAFTSKEFKEYCEEEGIEHIEVTTGVPRGNGQVERVHRTLIPVLTKLCLQDQRLWFKHVSKLQRALNSTYHRSIDTTPFTLMFGCNMRNKEDIELQHLLQQESSEMYQEDREELRVKAREQIQKIQEENKRQYDSKRKEGTKYKEGDMVAIKRTQFGSGLKLKQKYFGPYRVTKVKRNDRYNVEKACGSAEGPAVTSTCAEYMKRWPTLT